MHGCTCARRLKAQCIPRTAPAAAGMSGGSKRPKPWEAYPPTAAGYADPQRGGWEDSGDDQAEPTPFEAGEEFASLLIRLRLQGTLSAKQTCILAYWATAAGARGPAAEFQAKPGMQSGKYQRVLDRYMKVSEDPEYYVLQVPGSDRGSGERCVHDIETVPPHEALATELAENPAILDQLRAGGPAADWAKNYTEHPVVVASEPGTVLPLALYCDGVPYTNLDGFLGFWIYNLVSWKRHLVAVVRKSQLCDCGCRRWCSLHPVFELLSWSLGALAAGIFPEARHDGRPWMPGVDDVRAGRGGSAAPRGAVVLLKGDWSEFCLTFGFTNWSSNRPCLFCHCGKDGLYVTENFTARTFPHPLKGDLDYETACAAAEVPTTFANELQLRTVAGLLAYDRRKDGSHGRALTRDVPVLGLLKGDRLEPSAALPDVAGFEDLRVFPVQVMFWRQSRQTWALHRNPLLNPALGIGINSFAVDILHTLNLGVYQRMVAKSWWVLLLSDAFGVSAAAAGRRNVEELVANGVPKLRDALKAWYAAFEAAHPGVTVNKLEELTVKTLGDRDGLMIKAKAAQTRPLVRFTADLLAARRAAIPEEHAAIVPAAAALADFADLLRTVPKAVPLQDVQRLMDLLKRYIFLADRGGIPPIPKVHLAMHLIHRTSLEFLFQKS